MAHYSIDDFREDKDVGATIQQSQAEPTKPSGSDTGALQEGSTGSAGADTKQADTNADASGSSDVSPQASSKGGNRRVGSKSGQGSAKTRAKPQK